MLPWCLQGSTGVTRTERTRLQAPPGYRAQLNLSRQPPVIWFLMKGGYWKKLSSETCPGVPLAPYSPCAGLQPARASCVPPPAPGSGMQPARASPASGEQLHQQTASLCSSGWGLSRFVWRLVGGEDIPRGLGEGKRFLHLFLWNCVEIFRLQAERTGSTCFSFAPLYGSGGIWPPVFLGF